MKAITKEETADILEASDVLERLDLGHSLAYKLKHPTIGVFFLINSAFGDDCMFIHN